MTDFTKYIRTIADYPKPGIMFRDITTLLGDSEGYRLTMDALVERYRDQEFDLIASIEARGFFVGGVMAHQLGKGFVPIRKPGKLPYKTYAQDYELEYGTDRIEIHVDAIAQDQKVLLADDLIATGGTALAAAQLIRQAGGIVMGAAFIINLPDLGGVARLAENNIDSFWLCEFEGE